MPWKHIGKWRYGSTILDFGSRWTSVVSFTPRYPFHSRLGGPQHGSGGCDEKKFAPVGILTPIVQHVARRCIDAANPTSYALVGIWTVRGFFHRAMGPYIRQLLFIRCFQTTPQHCFISSKFLSTCSSLKVEYNYEYIFGPFIIAFNCCSFIRTVLWPK
jgi:hypothetical protein